LRTAAEVEEALRLGKIEVDRAALAPPGTEETRESLGALERLEQMPEVAPHVGIAIDERLLHATVGEPRVAPHDRVVEGRAEEPSARLVLEPDRLHEAILAGLQAADAGRELLRQHRDHAVREVHARAART